MSNQISHPVLFSNKFSQRLSELNKRSKLKPDSNVRQTPFWQPQTPSQTKSSNISLAAPQHERLSLSNPLSSIFRQPQQQNLDPIISMTAKVTNQLHERKVPRPRLDDSEYYITPAYHNLHKFLATEDGPQLLALTAKSDRLFFLQKLRAISLLPSLRPTSLSLATYIPSDAQLWFLNFLSFSDVDPSPRRFEDFIGSDNLLHYLQTHPARRFFARMNRIFHFHHDIFRIIFPFGTLTTKTSRSQLDCPYHCSKFFQNCDWHLDFEDQLQSTEYVKKAREEFLIIYIDFLHDPTFWHSLVLDLHCEFNRQKSVFYVENPRKTEFFLRRMLFLERDEKLDLQLQALAPGVHYQTLSSKDFPQFDPLPQAQSNRECPHCSLECESFEEYAEHLELHTHTVSQPEVNTEIGTIEYVRTIFMSQVDMLINAYTTAKAVVPSYLRKYKRFLINVFSAVLNMVGTTEIKAVLLSATILINEISEEFPHLIKTTVDALSNSLKKVISRFYPTAQAQPSKEHDDKVANEMFVTSFFELLRSMMPWERNVDSSLLKARVQRIEIFARCLRDCSTLGQWFMRFFQQLWHWIQIYFFGATEEELKELAGLVASGDIERWVQEINDFEVERTENLVSSRVPSIMNDKESQAKVLDFKKRGEIYLSKLSLKGLPADLQLLNLVKIYNNKVNRWYKIFEDSLGAVDDKHEPFIIYLYGDPGVGKTYCVNYIIQALMKATGKEFDPARDIFAKPRDSEYFDGYSSQFCLLMDDFLQTTDPTANSSELGFLIDAGSRAKLHLNMATLEKKSVTYFNSPVVLVTSNKELTAAGFEGKVQSYAALSRRFDLMVEVRRLAGWSPDTSKKFDPSGMRFLLSTFHLDRKHQDGGSWVPITYPTDWYTFRDLAVQMFLQKQKKQRDLDTLEELPQDYADKMAEQAKFFTTLTGSTEQKATQFVMNITDQVPCNWQIRSQTEQQVTQRTTYERQFVARSNPTSEMDSIDQPLSVPTPADTLSLASFPTAFSDEPPLEKPKKKKRALFRKAQADLLPLLPDDVELLPSPDYTCKALDLRQMHVPGANNNCFFESVRVLMHLAASAETLREDMATYVATCHNLRPKELESNQMITTDLFPTFCMKYRVNICLHTQVEGLPETHLLWKLRNHTSVQTLHLLWENQHYSPLIKHAKDLVKVTCHAPSCKWTTTTSTPAADFYYHLLEASRPTSPLEYHHHLAAPQNDRVLLELPLVITEITAEMAQQIKQINQNYPLYSPPGSPYTLSELVLYERTDLLQVLLEYYQRHDARSSWKQLVSYPYNWCARQVTAVTEVVSRTIRRACAPLVSLQRAADQTTHFLTVTLENLKKWATIGLALGAAAACIHMLLSRLRRKEPSAESFGPSSSSKTKSAKKLKRDQRRVEAEYSTTDDSTDSERAEAFGPSSSAKTQARAKLRKDQRRIEGDELPEVTYLSPFQLSNVSPHLRFRRVGPSDRPRVVINTTRSQTLRVTFPTDNLLPVEIRGDREEKMMKLIALLEENFAQKSESLKDKLALVEETLNDLPLAEASRDPTMMDVMYAVTPNLFLVRNLQSGLKVRGVFLQGSYALVPNHLFASSDLQKGVTLQITTNTAAQLPITIYRKHLVARPEKDVALIDLSGLNLPAKPSIISKFIDSDEDLALENGYILVANPMNDGTLRMLAYKTLTNMKVLQQMQYIDPDDKEAIVIQKAVNYNGDSEKGECGSLIFRMDPRQSRKILGIHVAGLSGQGTGTLVTQTLLREMLSAFSEAQAVREYPIVPCENADIFYDCEEPEEDLFLELPFVTVLGDSQPCRTPSQPHKTSLMPSPLQGEFGPPLSKPAPMKIRMDEDGKIHDPLKKALSKLHSPQIHFDQQLVDLCAKRMQADYADNGWLLDPHPERNGKLDLQENIRGSETDQWVKPVNMKTSPGYPYVLAGGKHLYIDYENAVLTPLVEEQLRRREEAARNGDPLPALMVDTMKDERLPNEKVDDDKVRIFSVCPLDFNLLVRKYFLRFLAQMMRHHTLGEVSVGINPHSEEWEVLFKRLKNSGSHWLAGDYSAWDKRSPYQVALALLPMVETFYKQFPDYDSSDAKVREVLIKQAFTCHRLATRGNRGIIYQVHQSMPSGIAVTAVYNSLINALLFRVIFAELAMKDGWKRARAVNTYKDHVSFVAYGDDHIARVSDVVYPFFNMISLEAQMAKHHIVYTSPSKEAVSTLEIPEDELTYLKRAFRVDSSMVHAPMAVPQIIDILNWVQAKSTYEQKEACKSAVLSVLIELTHHPKGVFNEWYLKIFAACIRRGIACPAITYEEALEARLSASFENDYELY
nr:MAG: nonstructural protein [Picornaviridae sp.]